MVGTFGIRPCKGYLTHDFAILLYADHLIETSTGVRGTAILSNKWAILVMQSRRVVQS
jgi:hypothetical protein